MLKVTALLPVVTWYEGADAACADRLAGADALATASLSLVSTSKGIIPLLDLSFAFTLPAKPGVM